MDICPTIKIKSTHPQSQGEYVEINQSDYNPTIHKLYGEPDHPGQKDELDGMKKADLQEFLKAKGVEFETDANKEALLALAKSVKEAA